MGSRRTGSRGIVRGSGVAADGFAGNRPRERGRGDAAGKRRLRLLIACPADRGCGVQTATKPSEALRGPLRFPRRFLLNLVLAVVADAYSASVDEQAAAGKADRETRLGAAFELLAKASGGGPSVSRGAMDLLVDELNVDAAVPHLDDNTKRLVFAVLDRDGDGELDRAEFELLADALKLRFEPVEASPDAASLRGRASTLVDDARFDVFVDLALVANLIVSAVAGGAQASRDVDGVPDTPAQLASACFCGLYAVEVALRCVAAGGPGTYLFRTSLQASFDGVVAARAVRFHVAAAASRRGLVSAEYPRRRRDSSPRNIHVAVADSSPRNIHVAVADSSPRNIRVAVAASPRLVSNVAVPSRCVFLVVERACS